MIDFSLLMKLCKDGRHGDAIALVATPIASALGLDCIDKATGKLREDSGCAKRRDAMNANGTARSGTVQGE